jgi:hypothetical protein
MAAPQFIVGADGFDRYPAGTLSPLWPWLQTNANSQLAITSAKSLFGSNALGVPSAATNSCGWVFQVPSTASFLRTNATKAGTGAFGFCGYIQVGNITTPDVTDLMLAFSSSANISAALPILGQTFSSKYGLSLALPTQVAGLASTNNPLLYAVKPNTWYWVGLYFSFQPTGKLLATYCINGKPIWQDVAVTWLTDILAAGQVLNALKVYNGVLAEWYMDDMIVHAVSSADASWPAPTKLTPEVLPILPPRQITLAQAVATASSNGFVSMNSSVPDYRSASDPAGAGVAFLETDTAAQGSELYTWNAQPHANINAVIYRGISTNPNQVAAVQQTTGAQTRLLDSNSQAAGTGGFTGVSENDGTSYWTQASIAAASFGQTAST